jgi:hypothetical protein
MATSKQGVIILKSSENKINKISAILLKHTKKAAYY